MDWEYYIDNDLSNSIVRSTSFYLLFRIYYNKISHQVERDNKLEQTQLSIGLFRKGFMESQKMSNKHENKYEIFLLYLHHYNWNNCY